MITINDLQNKEENYAWWLSIMTDEMPRMSILPREVRDHLNYSLESLDVIERYIRLNYTVDELKEQRNRFARDLFARYIGETFRKNLPDLYWSFESTDEEHHFYGIPVLSSLQGEEIPPMTPTLWVTELIGQEGNFLRSLVRKARGPAGAGPGARIVKRDSDNPLAAHRSP